MAKPKTVIFKEDKEQNNAYGLAGDLQYRQEARMKEHQRNVEIRRIISQHSRNITARTNTNWISKMQIFS